MSLHEYPKMEQRSPEWFDARCGIVTASVVGRLVTSKTLGASELDCSGCGAVANNPCASKRTGQPIATLHPERTEAAKADDSPPILVLADDAPARDLAAMLAAERIAGSDPDTTFLTNDMYRGIFAEGPAREMYADHYGTEVTECGFMVREEHGYRIGYSPDGLVGDEGLIEIKSPRRKGHLLTAVNDVVPAQHVAQIQAGLLVSGRAWCDFISYNGGMRPWVKRVTPDPDWFLAIHAAVGALEGTIQRLVSDYTKAVDGFPMTERLDLEVVI